MMGKGFGPGMVLKGRASSHPRGFSWLMGWFESTSATEAKVFAGESWRTRRRVSIVLEDNITSKLQKELNTLEVV